MSEAIRFRFDFADLAPAVDLRVIDGGMPVPDQATPVAAHPRPAWLRPMLPIFAEGRGLRVEVARPAAPSYARVLQEGLAGLFASAAAGSGVSVVGWDHNLLIGSHGLERMPLEPHLTLVAAELLPESLEMAAGYLRLLPAERTVLVLNGSLPGVERMLPVPAAATHRTPLLGARELSSRAHGVPASLGSAAFGRACLELAQEACRRYREWLP